MCEERASPASLCHSLRLSHPFLSLSLWGEVVNNAGGLADLCEPEALRKAGVPGGDTTEREGGGWVGDECAVWRAVPYRSLGCLDDDGSWICAWRARWP